MTNKITIWRFLDGKPGHEKQSQALVDIIGSIETVDVVDFLITDPSYCYLLQWLQKKPVGPHNATAPSIIIGAGHRTHLPLLIAAKQQQCQSLVIMSPSLPNHWFDIIIAPEHDYPQQKPANVITVPLAIATPVQNTPDESKGLILVGGINKHTKWEIDKIIQQIDKILIVSPKTIRWNLSTSPRTPNTDIQILTKLSKKHSNLNIYDYNQLPRNWLSEELLQAKKIWVTYDSASMLAEALSTQADVGIISTSTQEVTYKFTNSITQLIQKRALNTIDSINESTQKIHQYQLELGQKIVNIL